MAISFPYAMTRGIDLASDAFGDRPMYGLHVAYIGTAASHDVAVAANGDLTFRHGDVGAEAVDPTVGSSGVIDVSGASLNTIGEVVVEINSSPNWLASYADLPPSFSSNDTLATRAAASVGNGTLLQVDPAQLGALQTGKVTLARALGLEAADDLTFDMHLTDRLTHPNLGGKTRDNRFRYKKRITLDQIRSQITGLSYSASNSVLKVVRLRLNKNTFAETEETLWQRNGATGGVRASGEIVFADNPTPSVQASGTIVFADNPTADVDTITVNSVVYTFTTAASTATTIQVKGTLPLTLDEALLVLAADTDIVATEDGTDTLTITAAAEGAAGNAITLASSADTASAANLENGVDGDTITIGAEVYTFRTAEDTANDIVVKGSLALTLDEMVIKITANDTNVTPTEDGTDTLTITYAIPGVIGNAYALDASADTPSGTTLENGAEGTEQFIPNNGGGASPIVIGNPGELLWFVFETTEAALPETVDITLAGFVDEYVGVAA